MQAASSSDAPPSRQPHHEEDAAAERADVEESGSSDDDDCIILARDDDGERSAVTVTVPGHSRHDERSSGGAWSRPRRRRTDKPLVLTPSAREALRQRLGGGDTRSVHARRKRGDG